MKNILKIVSIVLVISFTLPNTYVFGNNNYREAIITDFSGEVNIMKSGGEKVFTAKKGMKLAHGDRIITGKNSWIKLDIDSTKEVKVGSRTYISLEELTYQKGEKTGIKLFKGTIWTNIKKKLSTDDSFEIRTPNAIMGARGTKFIVSYTETSINGNTENRSKLTVIEGIVEAITVTKLKAKDKDGNIINKNLTISTYVEEGQEVEFISTYIEKEIQKTYDNIQLIDKHIKTTQDYIKEQVENKIKRNEISSISVNEINYNNLNSFSLDTIIEDIKNSDNISEETNELINNLEDILYNVIEEEIKIQNKLNELITEIVNETNTIYNEIANEVSDIYNEASNIYDKITDFFD